MYAAPVIVLELLLQRHRVRVAARQRASRRQACRHLRDGALHVVARGQRDSAGQHARHPPGLQLKHGEGHHLQRRAKRAQQT
jgi:hypothetical protein